VTLVGPLPQPSGVQSSRTLATEERRSDSTPAAVEADPVRLQQILGNLLGNAVRHTPSGGRITVTVDQPEPAWVRFTVADTGPGFPAEQLPGLFDRFTKSEGSGGSGLGLAIARDLVLAHGGTIEATNQPSGGAVVSFRLPAGGPVDR